MLFHLLQPPFAGFAVVSCSSLPFGGIHAASAVATRLATNSKQLSIFDK